MNLQMKNMLIAIKNALHNTSEPLVAPDYTVIFQNALKQSLLPIVFQGCYEQAQRDNYEKLAYVRTDVYNIISMQTVMAYAFADVYEKFRENGIKAVVFKGIVCRSLYGELGNYRISADEDVIIDTADFYKAKDILIGNGFVLEDENLPLNNLDDVQEATFVDKSSGLILELHFNFFSNSSEMFKRVNREFENAFDNKIAVSINDADFYTLDYTDNYLFLFFHLYKHFLGSGVGLRQITDLHMFETSYGRFIDWDRVEEMLKRYSAWGFYGDILAVGNEYLGFKLSQRSPRINPEMLIDDIEQAGVFGGKTEAQLRSAAFTRTALDDKKDKAFLKCLFPSVDKMKKGYPELYEKPYLLPVVWVKRFAKNIAKFSRKGKWQDLIETNKIAKQRKKLLKQYDIL